MFGCRKAASGPRLAQEPVPQSGRRAALRARAPSAPRSGAARIEAPGGRSRTRLGRARGGSRTGRSRRVPPHPVSEIGGCRRRLVRGGRATSSAGSLDQSSSTRRRNCGFGKSPPSSRVWLDRHREGSAIIRGATVRRFRTNGSAMGRFGPSASPGLQGDRRGDLEERVLQALERPAMCLVGRGGRHAEPLADGLEGELILVPPVEDLAIALAQPGSGPGPSGPRVPRGWPCCWASWCRRRSDRRRDRPWELSFATSGGGR